MIYDVHRYNQDEDQGEDLAHIFATEKNPSWVFLLLFLLALLLLLVF